MKGLIIKGIGGFYYVKSQEIIYECKARGIFRKDNIKPMVGDYVEIDVQDNHKGNIIEIFDRKTILTRPPVSNVSQVIVVGSILSPDINYDLINRIIVSAENRGIKIILSINKCDLINQTDMIDIRNKFINSGYPIVFTSAKEEIGLKELSEYLNNNISVFAGPSGVGKSSLLNMLCPDLNLQTGEVSKKIKRGKHTTRHVELFDYNSNGFIVDTPGFSNLDLINIDEMELMHMYPEFNHYFGNCKFTSCLHDKEPKCAVKEALLSTQIAKERYDSYIRLLREIQEYNKYKY